MSPPKKVGHIVKRRAIALAVMLVGCGTYKPPQPPSPRDATHVNASMGRTWDAVIDLFAQQNLPIRTIERVSGIIATDRLSVGAEGSQYADCGKLNGVRLRPELANYNVLVRGDSSNSTVKVTVLWTNLTDQGQNIDCATTHVWETGIEEKVKSYAQSSSLRAGSATATVGAAASEAQPATAPDPQPPKRDPGPTPKATSTPQPGPPAGQVRTNAELQASVAFRLAAEDAQRLGLIGAYHESGEDSLTVALTDKGVASAGLEHYLAKIFSAYRVITDWSPATTMLLVHDGREIGTVTRGMGLTRGDWR